MSRVAETRAMDRKAIEEYGNAPGLLMENAGHAVYYVILREFGVEGRTFAGTGLFGSRSEKTLKFSNFTDS